MAIMNFKTFYFGILVLALFLGCQKNDDSISPEILKFLQNLLSIMPVLPQDTGIRLRSLIISYGFPTYLQLLPKICEMMFGTGVMEKTGSRPNLPRCFPNVPNVLQSSLKASYG